MSKLCSLNPARVVVFPSGAFFARQRLFKALGDVFRVVFLPQDDPPARGADAAIRFRSRPPDGPVSALPSLEFVVTDQPGSNSGDSDPPIRFSDSALLDQRLRNQSLLDRFSPHHELQEELGQVLGLHRGRPFWRAVQGDCRRDFVSVAPEELARGDSLRDRCQLEPSALLPLVHFLRQATGYSSWERPPLRGTFVIDDPNLHRPSYGFVRFAALAQHAREHGYHLSFATIPLDAWFTHERTATIFRQASSELSLAVHGNDHVYRELEAVHSADEAFPLLHAALRRIERLERRARLSVSRVMVPPHGVCADHVYAPLVATGFEALCRAPSWWKHRSEPLSAIGGWGMADMTQDGLPVLARHRFADEKSLDALVVAGFLDQPLIPYGHHWDLADGYDGLASVKAAMERLGAVRWTSLSRIARSNYMTRAERNGGIRVRLFSRSACLTIPNDVNEIVIELPAGYPSGGLDTVVCEGRSYEFAEASQEIASAPIGVEGGSVINIRLQSPTSPSRDRRLPRTRVARAAIRRATTEGRDRLGPMIKRAGLEPSIGRLEAAFHAARDQVGRSSP